MPHPVSRSQPPSDGSTPRRKPVLNKVNAGARPPRPRSRWWEQLWGNWFRVNLEANEPIVHGRVVAFACLVAIVTVGATVASLAPRSAPAGPQAASAMPRLENEATFPPVADARPEDWVASVTDSPPSATDLIPFDELCLGEIDPTPATNDDRPEGIPAAPSTLRTADVPAAAGSVLAQPAKIIRKRRDLADDEELRKQLVQMTELNLTSVPLKERTLVAQAPKNKKFTAPEIPAYAGLPLRMGVDCQIGKEPAAELEMYSRKLRDLLAPKVQGKKTSRSRTLGDPRDNADVLRARLEEERDFWTKPEAVRTLVQMLMAEDKPIRRVLVEYLAGNPCSAASAALAQRALFDLAFEVREAAVEALRWRPREEYRRVLLDGFRYPWAPVADHAAEALIAVNDRQAVPELEKLLLEPDPHAPLFVVSQGKLGVRELVRINHLANCTMCHAASTSTMDPVRGRIPSPSQPLPPPVEYYQNGDGNFVRADVTYLRQDFSVMQPVPHAHPWPVNQRFDYLVRFRYLSAAEIASPVVKALAGSEKKPDSPSLQKEAVLFALNELRVRQVNSPVTVAQNE